MRTRTLAVGLLVLLALGGVAAYGLTRGPSGSLSVNWASQTSRPNQVNHHPVVAERVDGHTDIVAPISSVAGPNARCAATMLDANGTVRWQRTINESQCFIHGIGDPLIADATGNGRANVLAPTTENRLYVYDASNGSTVWTQNLTSFGYSGPQVLTEPRRLVVQPDFNGTVFADGANGTLQWVDRLNETAIADTHVVNVTGDPYPDVAVGTYDNVTVIRPNGSVAWKREARASWLAKGRVDGRDELIASGGVPNGGEITAFAANGTRLWRRTGWKRPSLSVVADGNGDGTPEVFVGSGGDTVAALNARTGKTVWKTTLSTTAQMMPAPVAGPIGPNGKTEVVAVTNHGTVHVLDPDTGAVRASYERKVAVWVHPTLFDTNGDGTDEILVMYGDGHVVSLSYHGG